MKLAWIGSAALALGVSAAIPSFASADSWRRDGDRSNLQAARDLDRRPAGDEGQVGDDVESEGQGDQRRRPRLGWGCRGSRSGNDGAGRQDRQRPRAGAIRRYPRPHARSLGAYLARIPLQPNSLRQERGNARQQIAHQIVGPCQQTGSLSGEQIDNWLAHFRKPCACFLHPTKRTLPSTIPSKQYRFSS